MCTGFSFGKASWVRRGCEAKLRQGRAGPWELSHGGEPVGGECGPQLGSWFWVSLALPSAALGTSFQIRNKMQ